MKPGNLLVWLLMLWTSVCGAAHLSSSIQITARCQGQNEVPTVNTDGQGLAIFTVDKNMARAELYFQATALSGPITGIHIHAGRSGENGGVIMDLTPYLQGDRLQTRIDFSDNLTLSGMLDGAYYINVHTGLYPGGEIRGQIRAESDILLGGPLSGEQEVPAIQTSGRGYASAVLSQDGTRLMLELLYDSLSGPVIGAHLHMGAAGTNGAVVLDLSGSILTGGIIRAAVDIDAGLSAALRSGEVYVNVHTALFPGGEIRGQMNVMPTTSFDCILSGDEEIPPVMTGARGIVQFNWKPEISGLMYRGFILGIESGVTGAHLHLGPAGSNGPVLANLSDSIRGNGWFSGMITLERSQIEALLSGGIYLNVHTLTQPDGEIRGQLNRLLREGYLAVLNGGQEVPATDASGSGIAMVSIDRNQQNAHFMLVVDSLRGDFASSHIHMGGPGVNGNVLFNLSPFFINGTATYGFWTDLGSNAALFRTSGVYFNIHTSDFPGGELRGNLIRGSNFSREAIPDPGFTGELLFTGRLSGSAQVPSNPSSGVGVMALLLDRDMDQAFINLTVNGLSSKVTGVHLHEASAGENGSVVMDLSEQYYKGRIQTGIQVDEDLLNALMRGDIYVNVHTRDFPDGELRAQLPLEQDPGFGSWLSGDQELPAVNTKGQGLATFTLTQVLNRLKMKILTDSLSSPVTGIHLHRGSRDMNGEVVADLTPGYSANSLEYEVDASPFLSDLMSGNIYLNVHTADHPNGEIRGQLDPVAGIQFDGWLSGNQENPAAITGALGLQHIVLDQALNTLQVRLQVNGLSGSMIAAHLHFGSSAENGPVWKDLSAGIRGSRIMMDIPDMDSAGIQALLQGRVYLNVHTRAFPGGEIRTQTYGTIRDAYSFDLCPEQETDIRQKAGLATGSAIVSIDRDRTNIHLMNVNTGLTDNITGLHIHRGQAGTDGPVVMSLSDKIINGGVFLYAEENSGAVIQTIQDGSGYINVHTDANPGGEMRGQIVRGMSCSPLQMNPEIELIDPLFDDQLLLVARLGGEAEVPSVSTDGLGLATIQVDRETGMATIRLTASKLSSEVTGIHIHRGEPGTNGPVVTGLTPAYQDGHLQADIAVDRDMMRDLLKGMLYINVHTESNPNGEIRGQIVLETARSFMGIMSEDQEVPASGVPQTGLITLHYTPNTGIIEINAQWEGLSSPVTGVHFHEAMSGENGPVVENLTGMVTGNSIRSKFRAEDYTDALLEGRIYINVHTVDQPNGAIRAQLEPVGDIVLDSWLTASQEVPEANSNAIGLGYFQINVTMDSIRYRIQMDNMSEAPMGVHIHSAPLGSNGAVIMDLTPAIDGLVVADEYSGITGELLALLLSGKTYVNVHTPSFPNGEIRGQLFRIARDGYAFDLCPEQEVNAPANTEGLIGTGMFAYNRDMDEAHTMFVVNRLSSDFGGAHIHEGAIGTDGNVRMDLSGLFMNNGVFTYITDESAVPFNTDLAALIRSGSAYVNIHTVQNPGGELRGQIVKESLCSAPTAVVNKKSLLALNVAPNPASQEIRIDPGDGRWGTGPVQLDVFDLLGRAHIQRKEITLPADLNISGLAPGNYLIRVTGSDAFGSIKIVVQ